ncbi:hypothetical protein CK203_063073 [Vitis vinifera]|uniref:Uncharacterized protein n=1 Tax=Vitis vinifera TaxID=29760 RepID=A0A438G664_VITVI|nr:hypothetical protein CK203_063073 [Vitis vinifera]
MVISIQPTIPFFEGKGYDTWSIKMRTLFISEDLWELVDKGYVEEEIPRDAMRDVRKNDAKTLFFIQQAITESIFPQISKATKSKEAWDTLQTKYQSTSLVAAQDGDGSQTDIPVMEDCVYEAAAKGDIDVLKKIPEQGHLEVVEALINAAREPTLDIETGLGPHKVMLRMKNKGKDTALHEAVRYRNYGVVMLLIEEDPDFTYVLMISGITPLYMAVEGGFTAAVKLIIEKSSTSPSYNGLMGRTALHAGCCWFTSPTSPTPFCNLLFLKICSKF